MYNSEQDDRPKDSSQGEQQAEWYASATNIPRENLSPHLSKDRGDHGSPARRESLPQASTLPKTPERLCAEIPSVSLSPNLGNAVTSPLTVGPNIAPFEFAEANAGADTDLEAQNYLSDDVSGAIGRFLHEVFSNSNNGNVAGWVCNAINAALRDGTITTLTTTVREVIGYAASRHLDRVDRRSQVIASSIILGGIGLLTVGAMVRQERTGKANALTRSIRGLTIGALGGISVAAWHKEVFASSAPQLVKVVVYAATRDSLNLFLKLLTNRSDARPTNVKAASFNMIAYTCNQMIVNWLQSFDDVFSGTSTGASKVGIEGAIRPIMKFSAANGLGEFLDAIVYSGLISFFDPAENQHTDPMGESSRAGVAGLSELRLSNSFGLPTWSAVETKVFDTMIPRAAIFSILFVLINVCLKTGEQEFEKLSEGERDALVSAIGALSIGLLLPLFLLPAAEVKRNN
ncbi:hypothetical protein [Pararhizobium arenae]|uniref:hypothetical protein n=1 Tax=Pararhizobium arenae TaxID=1856850 RepID=UPI000A8719A0|nr:hypothetical protein [Pararhizobium arenae]